MAKGSKVKGALAAALIGATALTGCARFEENEAGFRIGANGAINEVIRGDKLVCVIFCDVAARSVIYKTFTDTFTISSGAGAATTAQGGAETTQARQFFLRTQDDMFINSITVNISYEINPDATDENLKKIYSEFRAGSGNPEENARLIRDDLQILVTDPLVQAIERFNAVDVQSNGTAVGTQVMTGLQAAVNARLGIGTDEVSPIIIRGVYMGGVGFDSETEAVMRQKALAAQQADIAQVAGGAAEAQARAAVAQAGVTAESYRALRGSVPAEQLSTAVCLDNLRQGRIPAGTNCFPTIMR